MASPSKNQNYAYLSRLSTQKLLELLAAAPAPAETPEDKAYIDALVEVVLEREERHPTGLLPDPEQAWEEFQQYYNTPEGEDLSLYPAENPGTAPSEPAPSQTEYRPQRRPKRHFFRRVVIVAAVVVCIALPPALGFENVFQMFGAWTDDKFLLLNKTVMNNFYNKEISEAKEGKYSSIWDALDDFDIAVKLVPKWFPEGFSPDRVIVNYISEVDKVEIRAYYVSETGVITIFCNKYNNAEAPITSFEKDTNKVKEYKINGITHYLFENLGKWVAVWTEGNIECSISGDINETELQKMLNSIYEG